MKKAVWARCAAALGLAMAAMGLTVPALAQDAPEGELEAIKLHDLDGLDQTQAALKMGVSQPTFARILDKAYKAIAEALIKGKAIRIE